MGNRKNCAFCHGTGIIKETDPIDISNNGGTNPTDFWIECDCKGSSKVRKEKEDGDN